MAEISIFTFHNWCRKNYHKATGLNKRGFMMDSGFRLLTAVAVDSHRFPVKGSLPGGYLTPKELMQEWVKERKEHLNKFCELVYIGNSNGIDIFGKELTA